jgi:hypothetical protein
MYVCTCNSCYRQLLRDDIQWGPSSLLNYNKAYAHRQSQRTGSKSKETFLFGVFEVNRVPLCMIKAVPSDLHRKPLVAELMERARGPTRQRLENDTRDAICLGASGGVIDAATSGSTSGAVTGATSVPVRGAAATAASGATQFLTSPHAAPPPPFCPPLAIATPMAVGDDAGTSINHREHTPQYTTPASPPATPVLGNIFSTPLRPLTPASLRPILDYGDVEDVAEGAQVPGDGEDVLVDDEDEEVVIPYHDVIDQDAELSPGMVTDAEEESKKLTPGKYDLEIISTCMTLFTVLGMLVYFSSYTLHIFYNCMR